MTDVEIVFTPVTGEVLQVLVSELLEHWGEEGFGVHVRKVQSEYSRRASLICKAADQHLKGLAEWEEPVAGMFLWVKVTVDGVSDLEDMLELLRDNKVVVVPGPDPLHFH
jgi:kynurenine/2-aminoadipate aminotransferase